MRDYDADLLSAAQEYHKQGLNVVPLRPDSKISLGSWGRWISNRQSEQDIHNLFSTLSSGNLAIVCGSVSGNLLVRDFDDADRYQGLIRDNAQFAGLVSGLPTVRTRRGVHIYFRTRRDRKTRKFGGDGELRGDDAYVVAPPSRILKHHYQWIRPLSLLKELTEEEEEIVVAAVLSKPVPARRTIQVSSSEPLSGMVPKGSRSDVESGLVLTLVGRNFTDEDIHDHFETNARPGTKFRDLGESRYKWLQRNIDTAREKLAKHRSEIDRDLEQLERFVFSDGMKGSTRQVALAVLQIARRAGKTKRLGVGVRELSEISGYSTTTASKAIKKVPFVKLTGEPRTGQATVYDLVLPSIDNENGLVVAGPKPTDVFCPDGLPHEAWTVYMVLVNWAGKALTTAQILQHCRLSERTVRSHLNKLQEYQIAQGDRSTRPHLWYVDTPLSQRQWQSVARKLGTDGTTYRKQIHHQRERDLYLRFVVRRGGERENS